MRMAVFDTHRYDRQALEAANADGRHELIFLEPRLNQQTAPLAKGCEAVCSFVNDRVDRETLQALHDEGVRFIALRCAGFNHVDLKAAADLGIRLARVPEYSPYAVAEHAVALILSLNRKIPKAHARVREGNFTLDGLEGFDLHGKTVGVIGTGRIGRTFAGIMRGFGCTVLLNDKYPNEEFAKESGCTYVELPELYRRSDIISLHVPLTPETLHMINLPAIETMKPGVMLINTGRGGLTDTKALIKGLKTGHIGAAGLDVYEEEAGIFFCDLSEAGIQDDLLARLMTFPNVLITAHQAFLTREALHNIADTTLENLTAFETGAPLVNEVGGSNCP
jgi:D-lactate dehydrogenase